MEFSCHLHTGPFIINFILIFTRLLTGLPCGSGPNLVCHGDKVMGWAGVTSQALICNNGRPQLLHTDPDFVSPRELLPLCRYKVRTRAVNN